VKRGNFLEFGITSRANLGLQKKIAEPLESGSKLAMLEEFIEEFAILHGVAACEEKFAEGLEARLQQSVALFAVGRRRGH
jgi:hypothetical protein